jgi:hypothetical protein
LKAVETAETGWLSTLFEIDLRDAVKPYLSRLESL